jgi:hypothetical protein
MFDLEQAISAWRKRMLAAGIKTPVPLEELEGHLREDIARQMESGFNAQQAFAISTKCIGQGAELKNEFKKAGEPIATRFIKLVGIACVSLALLFSLWTFLFLFSPEISLTAKVFGLAAVATTLLSWRFNHRFLPVIRHRLIRTAVGFACCVGCVVWIQLFIINFLPHTVLHPGTEEPRGALMAIFLWGWTVMAILGGMAYGLEKAARKNNEQHV